MENILNINKEPYRNSNIENNIQKYTEIAEILKALAHPIRICILRNLYEQHAAGIQPANVSHLQSCVNIPQSTLSQHLQKLRIACIISGKRHGVEIVYEVSDNRVLSVLDCFFKQNGI